MENQSLNWDRVNAIRINQQIHRKISDGPFDAGWPTNSRGRKYEIILGRNGIMYFAYVDDSEAHRADGIVWRSIDSSQSWPKESVAAWKLVKE